MIYLKCETLFRRTAGGKQTKWGIWVINYFLWYLSNYSYRFSVKTINRIKSSIETIRE